jgi:prepilin-type processing-associated H-X9-DG protein
MSNLKQIGNACSLYMDDFDGRLPPARAWQDAVTPYLPNTAIFNCPEAGRGPTSYAFNATLDHAKRKEIVDPASAPLAYDSYLPGPNATDWLQSFARRHERSDKKGWGNVAFVDGHAHAFRTAPPAGAGLRQVTP